MSIRMVIYVDFRRKRDNVRCVFLGGNQRDLARAKNQKKQQEMNKKKSINNDGLTVEQRKHR